MSLRAVCVVVTWCWEAEGSVQKRAYICWLVDVVPVWLLRVVLCFLAGSRAGEASGAHEQILC